MAKAKKAALQKVNQRKSTYKPKVGDSLSFNPPIRSINRPGQSGGLIDKALVKHVDMEDGELHLLYQTNQGDVVEERSLYPNEMEYEGMVIKKIPSIGKFLQLNGEYDTVALNGAKYIEVGCNKFEAKVLIELGKILSKKPNKK